jgi:hypothetical protein
MAMMAMCPVKDSNRCYPGQPSAGGKNWEQNALIAPKGRIGDLMRIDTESVGEAIEQGDGCETVDIARPESATAQNLAGQGVVTEGIGPCKTM